VAAAHVPMATERPPGSKTRKRCSSGPSEDGDASNDAHDRIDKNHR
jgi:hypothetical protein